jgi:hypothetical protein
MFPVRLAALAPALRYATAGRQGRLSVCAAAPLLNGCNTASPVRQSDGLVPWRARTTLPLNMTKKSRLTHVILSGAKNL